MSRADKRDTELRAMIETIGCELAIIRRAMPITRLRIEQARDRTGLTSLLCPALDEIDDVSRSASVIGDQVTAALAKLKE
ncbi:MAG: hypothetical protein HY863_15610 [Chloroflexi bacterium]|nr:hypothetical protein [Chloroflexota bacterium]